MSARLERGSEAEIGGAVDGCNCCSDRRGCGLMLSLFRSESTEGPGTDWYGMALADCDNTYRYNYSGETGALIRCFWRGGGGSG